MCQEGQGIVGLGFLVGRISGLGRDLRYVVVEFRLFCFVLMNMVRVEQGTWKYWYGREVFGQLDNGQIDVVSVINFGGFRDCFYFCFQIFRGGVYIYCDQCFKEVIEKQVLQVLVLWEVRYELDEEVGNDGQGCGEDDFEEGEFLVGVGC